MDLGVGGSSPLIHPTVGKGRPYVPAAALLTVAGSYLSYRNILTIALPMVLGSLGQNLVQFADTAFLGRLGEVPLGAAALGGILYFVLFLVGHAFNTGMQIIAARRAGEGNRRQVGSTLDHQMLLVAVVAVLLFFLLYFGRHSLIPLLVRSEELQRETLLFLGFRSWGIFLGLFNSALMAFYLSIGNTHVNIYSTLAMAAVNVVLDYAFIFGRLGSPPMGVAGAALASVLSEAVATSIFLLYLLRKQFHVQYSLFRWERVQPSTVRHMVWLASPLVLQNLISVGSWFLFFVAIERYMGATALAVSNVSRSVYTLAGMPVWALGSTINAMTSHLIGQGHADDLFRLLGRVSRLSLLYSITTSIVMILMPLTVLRLYTNDPVLLSEGAATLQVVALATVLLSVSVLFIFAVSGTGATQMALFIEIICIGFYILYLYVVLNTPRPTLPQVWLAEAVYWVLALLLCIVYLKSGRWKRQTV